MRVPPQLAIAPIVFLLAACGDAGSGAGIASAPVPVTAPVPAPTPTPTPTPTSIQVYSGASGSALAVTTASQTFDPGETGPSGPLAPNASNWGDSLRIARDSTGGYSIDLSMPEANTVFAGEAVSKHFDFPISSQTSTNSQGTTAEFVTHASGNGSWDGTLNLDLAGPGKGRSYVNMATLTACNANPFSGCTPDNFARSFMVFGVTTPLAEIPLAGSAGYSGTFQLPAKNGNDLIEGTIGLSVNFANHAISGSLTKLAFSIDAGFNGAVVAEPDIALIGTISSNGFLSGTLAPGTDAKVASGSWAANFFGPNAAEVGGTMLLTMKPGFADTYFAGTFAGKKQ